MTPSIEHLRNDAHHIVRSLAMRIWTLLPCADPAPACCCIILQRSPPPTIAAWRGASVIPHGRLTPLLGPSLIFHAPPMMTSGLPGPDRVFRRGCGACGGLKHSWRIERQRRNVIRLQAWRRQDSIQSSWCRSWIGGACVPALCDSTGNEERQRVCELNSRGISRSQGMTTTCPFRRTNAPHSTPMLLTNVCHIECLYHAVFL